MNVEEIRKTFKQLKPQEQEEFVNSLSPEDANSLISAIESKPEKTRDYSFGDVIKAIPDVIEYGPSSVAQIATPSGREGFMVGAGKTVVDTGNRIRQLFSSPDRAQQIGEDYAYDERLRQQQISQESPAFRGGMRVGQAAPVAATIPLIPQAGALGITSGLGRVAYGTGVGAGYGGAVGSPVVPEEGQSIRGQFLKDTAKGALFGLGASTAIEAAPYLSPSYVFLKREAQRFINPKDAEEAAKFAPQAQSYKNFVQSGGDVADMAPSQVFGSRYFASLESGVSKSAKYADEALNTAVKSEAVALGRLNNILNQYGKRLSPEKGARVLSRAQYAAEREADAVRRTEGFWDYGKVKKLLGDQPVIGSVNYTDELLKVADELAATGNRTAAASVLKQARAYQSSVRNIDQAIKFRSLYNDVSAGKRSAFGLPRDESPLFGKRLSDAITRDMEASADVLAPQAKQLLKTANDNYKANSIKLDEIRDTVLGKVLNAKTKRPVEAFAEAMDKATPTQLAKQLRIIEDVSPQFANQAKRMYVDRMIEGSLKSPSALTTEANIAIGNVPRSVDIPKFTQQLRDQQTLNILFKDKTTQAQVTRIANNLERMSDLKGMGGATSIQSETTTMGGVLASQSSAFAARLATSFVFRNVVYKGLFTPEGRRALYVMTSPNQSIARYSAAMTYFSKELREEPNGNEVQ